jgi:hypothetical protein
VIAQPARQATARNVAAFLLNQVFFQHGFVKTVVFDGASYNRSKFVHEILSNVGSHIRFSSPLHHTGMAPVERANRSVNQVLRAYVDNASNDWSRYLPACVFALNASVHSATGSTPHFLIYGRSLNSPLDIEWDSNSRSAEYLEKLHNARERAKYEILLHQERTRTKYDANRLQRVLAIGQYVMLSYPSLAATGTSRKLAPFYKGPFKITACLSPIKYEVEPLYPPYKRQIIHADHALIQSVLLNLICGPPYRQGTLSSARAAHFLLQSQIQFLLDVLLGLHALLIA